MTPKRLSPPISTPKTRCAALVGALAALTAPQAAAYDIDCKLILCMAGSFPAGCGDAKSYMIGRITALPPKPPIGFCPLGGVAGGTSGGYDAYHVSYRFLRSEREAWACPEGKQIAYWTEEVRGRILYSGARCFETARQTCTQGRSESCRTVYTGEVPAIRYDMKFEITVEPGTANEFRSGVQYLGFR